MSHIWRVRVVGAAGALMMLAALYALFTGYAPASAQQAKPIFDVFVLSTGPVNSGDKIIVCPVAFDRSFNPEPGEITVKLTTDRVYYEEAAVPANTCKAVEVKRVVTNQLWVDACYGGACVEKSIQAAGPIMLATGDVINILLLLNVVQFMVIVFLMLKVQGKV